MQASMWYQQLQWMVRVRRRLYRWLVLVELIFSVFVTEVQGCRCLTDTKRAVVEEPTSNGYCMCTQPPSATGTLPTTGVDNIVEPNNTTWLIAGLSAGGGVLLLAAIGVGVCVALRKRRSDDHDDDGAIPMSNSAASSGQYTAAPAPPATMYDTVPMTGDAVYEQASAPLQ